MQTVSAANPASSLKSPEDSKKKKAFSYVKASVYFSTQMSHAALASTSKPTASQKEDFRRFLCKESNIRPYTVKENKRKHVFELRMDKCP